MIRILNSIKFNFPNVLATIIILCCFAYFFWISSALGAGANHNIGEVKTAMIALVMLIANYYYGSSSSSKQDRATIQEALRSNTAAAQDNTPAKTELSGSVELKQP